MNRWKTIRNAMVLLVLLAGLAPVGVPHAAADVYCGGYSNSSATYLLGYGFVCGGTGGGCTECSGPGGGGGWSVCVADAFGTYCTDYQY